jgi:hypothetical protein
MKKYKVTLHPDAEMEINSVFAIKDPARLNWKPLSKIEQYQVAASDIVKAKP